MRYSPFGTPIPPYEDEYENEDETSEHKTCNRIRKDVYEDILNNPLHDQALKVQAEAEEEAEAEAEEELADSDPAQQSPEEEDDPFAKDDPEEDDPFADEYSEDESDEDETTELGICRRIRDCNDETSLDEMIFHDSLIDMAVEMQPKEKFEEPDPVQQSSKGEAGPCKRAQHLSGLAGQIVEDRKLLITEEGQTFAYQEEGGYFRPVSSPSIYIASCFPKETRANLLERDVQEILKRLPWDSCIRCSPDDFNLNPEMVNLANGVFNLETSELLPHDAKYRFTYQVQAKYLGNSELVCPSFDQFCKTSLEGDEDKRTLLLEFIGYICAGTNNGKCALFLKGQPNSGKSVISSFIAKLFDAELVSNIPLHQLGDRFFRAELFGKKLNVAGEIAGRNLNDISIFKSITGNDRIAGEFKGQNPFYFTPHCKLLFSGNTLPVTTETDTTAAFVNRIRVLLFNTSVPSAEQDKRLLDKLWEERNAIVTLALRAVQDLAKRNFEFSLPKDSKEFLASFAMRGNIIQGFLDECCILGPGERVFNVDLYKALENYCARNGLERPPKQRFYELLSGVPDVFAKRIRIGTENRQGHVGIGLKKDVTDTGTMEQQP